MSLYHWNPRFCWFWDIYLFNLKPTFPDPISYGNKRQIMNVEIHNRDLISYIENTSSANEEKIGSQSEQTCVNQETKYRYRHINVEFTDIFKLSSPGYRDIIVNYKA